MKKMKLWMLAAILLCGFMWMTSCNGNANADKVAEDTVKTEKFLDFMSAVDKYLTDSIGSHYAEGEVCIPYEIIVSADKSRPDSVMLWGDFWVFNYNVAGDTLKTVSGGSHIGMMTIKKDKQGEYAVISFEQVEDGHGLIESAKRIFGDKFDSLDRIMSDDKLLEETRALNIAKYVKEHDMPVKYYQDFGWPAKEIKLARSAN